MGAGVLKNQAQIKGLNPYLYESLVDLQAQVNSAASQVNAQPDGQNTAAPPAISSVQVTAAQGVFDIVIQDNNPVKRGVVYFVEWSTTAAFNQPRVIYLGPSRDWRGFLGNQTLFFRAFSQYVETSGPSSPVYFGSLAQPTPVAGGGSISGPVPQAGAGSGTAPTDGKTPGAGFGLTPSRGN
jgi:hypothetical protein